MTAPELWHVGDEAFKHFPSSETSGCCCFICIGLNFCRCYLPLFSTWWCHRNVQQNHSRPVQTELYWSIMFSFYPVLNCFHREQFVWDLNWAPDPHPATETTVSWASLSSVACSRPRSHTVTGNYCAGLWAGLPHPRSVGSVCSWMLLMGRELFSSTLISSKKEKKKKKTWIGLSR